MKKLLSLLLSLCLVFGLAGCGAAEDAAEEVTDQLFQKTGFSITLPSDAQDNSVKETAETEPFLLIAGDITICAAEQYKLDYGYDMTAEEYANVLVEANGYSCPVELKDGIATFSFEEAASGLTYLCITKVTDSSFWYINATCKTDLYEANQETMWKYLTSVKTSATAMVVDTTGFQTVTIEDLTMQLPADAEDVTEEWATGATFSYMVSDENALMATREAKSSIEEDVESLEYYCNNLIIVNELDSVVKTHNGIPYFTYTSDDDAFTYLVTVYEGTDSYWYMQSYTETDMFSLLEERLWSYLETVQIA